MRQQLTIGTAEADAFAVWSNAYADLVAAERAIRVVARVAAGCFTDLENLEVADCRLGLGLEVDAYEVLARRHGVVAGLVSGYEGAHRPPRFRDERGVEVPPSEAVSITLALK